MTFALIGVDLTAHSFGRLTVIAFEGSFRKPSRGCEKRWRCRCVCGVEKSVSQASLRSGHSRSCGCLHREQMSVRFKKHGECSSKMYAVWCTMKQRCSNPNDEHWHYYGGRGIAVCERWLEFENFARDMGPAYREGLEIERLDNEDGYNPLNCTWATRLEQIKHRRCYRKKFEYGGRVTTYRELADQWGVPVETAARRVRFKTHPANFKV